jgi:hypothetical protein
MKSFQNKILFNKYKKYIRPKTIPAMTSENELAFLRYYAENTYKGKGDIIDLGCWFGATSIALAQGIINNTRNFDRIKRIKSYDLFKWEDSLNYHVKNTAFENIYKAGDDYTETVRQNIKPLEQYIEIKGNILETNWEQNPVEFLFIDAMKNIETTNKILSDFYPNLIPKVSYVVYQDFDHYLTPWIHILVYLHRKHFKHIHDIYPSGSSIFQLKKKLNPNLIKINFREIDNKIIDSAFKYSQKLAIRLKQSNIAAAHIKAYILKNEITTAKYWLRYYLNKNYSTNSELGAVKQELENL